MKIIESEKAKRITSLEISALKGMRHEAVKKIINRLVTQDQIPAPAKEFGQIRDKIGRFRSVYVYAFYGDSAELLNTIFPPAVIPAETKVESCGLESAKEAADQPAASQEIVLPPIDPGAVRTMSSREIAELTGKAHFHVMRDLRALKEQLGAMFGGAIQSWIHPQNRQEYEEFVIDKDTCLTLLLGYDPVARMKVVKRWQALESQVAQQRSTGHGQPLALSQMFAMLSEQAGKIEQELRRQAKQIPHSPQLIPASARLCFYDRPNLAAQEIAALAKTTSQSASIALLQSGIADTTTTVKPTRPHSNAAGAIQDTSPCPVPPNPAKQSSEAGGLRSSSAAKHRRES